jgi:hypothetical protein
MDDAVWRATTFTKNRDRLVAGGVSEAFFAAVVRQADTRGLLSREHFTVEGPSSRRGRVTRVFARRTRAQTTTTRRPRRPAATAVRATRAPIFTGSGARTRRTAR